MICTMRKNFFIILCMIFYDLVFQNRKWIYKYLFNIFKNVKSKISIHRIFNGAKDIVRLVEWCIFTIRISLIQRLVGCYKLSITGCIPPKVTKENNVILQWKMINWIWKKCCKSLYKNHPDWFQLSILEGPNFSLTTLFLHLRTLHEF